MHVLSGPVLGLHAEPNNSLLIGQGSSVLLRDTGNGINAVYQELQPGNLVHSIRKCGDMTVSHGGREVVLSNGVRIQTKDWVLSTLIHGQYLFVVVMHNRVEVYDLVTCALVGMIQSPVHALLYSAEIFVSDTNSNITVLGGGVMCDMHFWTFNHSFAVVSHNVVRHHKGSIFRIRYSSERHEILTTSDDRSVCLWKQSDSDWIVHRTFTGHQARVWDAVFVGEKYIATACEDSHIRIFDRQTCKLVKTLSGHDKDVRVLATTGDGGVLFSGGEDGCVRKWSVCDSPEELRWEIPDTITKDWIRGIHLLNHSVSSFAVATNFGHVYVIRDGRVVSESRIDSPESVAITASAVVGVNCIVLGTADGSLATVNLSEGSSVSLSSNPVVPVRVVSLFPVGTQNVLVANHCGDLVLVDIASNSVAGTFKVTRGDTQKPSGKITAFSVYSESVWLLGDDKGFMYMIDTKSKTCTSQLISRTDKIVSIGRNENELIANLSNGVFVRVGVDSANGLSVSHTTSRSPHVSFLCKSSVPAIGFNSTDFIVYDSTGVQFQHTCGGHRRPFDYHVNETTNEAIFVYASDQRSVSFVKSRFRCETIIKGCCGDLIHAIVSVDGTNRFITGNEDSNLRLVEYVNGNEVSQVACIRPHEGSIRALCRVGSLILSGGARSQLVVSRINEDASRIEVVTSMNLPGSDDVRIMGIAGSRLNESNQYVFTVVTSACNIFFITIGANGELVELAQSQSIEEISKSVCLSVAYVRQTDARSLFAIGSGNGYICLIDAVTRSVIRSNRVHPSGINALVTCGNYLISGGDDQSIAVVDSHSLQILSRTENASACSIRALASDSKRGIIFSTGTDRLVSQWSLDSDGRLTLQSQQRLSITDPLSLTLLDEQNLAIGGRGVQVVDICTS